MNIFISSYRNSVQSYERLFNDNIDTSTIQGSFENFMRVVGLKSIKYKKERVEILAVLEEEKNFKENHPKYCSVFWN